MSDQITRRRILQLTAASAGIGLAGCVGGDDGGSTPTAEPTPTPTESTATPTAEETPTAEKTPATSIALSVTDTESGDGTVTIPEASIDEAGWLVIHPEASGGGPNGGVTLAERHLEPGTYGSIELSLGETLSEDQTLYAMLHYDDPADGEFTFPSNGDPPVTREGSPLVKPFAVTVGTTATVEMENTAFVPERLSIEPGTTVEWVNRDGYPHDVQSAQFHDTAASWNHYSGNLGEGDTSEFTFDADGVYEYYCTIHGRRSMCGAVLVGDVSLDRALPCEDGGGGSTSY